MHTMSERLLLCAGNRGTETLRKWGVHCCRLVRVPRVSGRLHVCRAKCRPSAVSPVALLASVQHPVHSLSRWDGLLLSRVTSSRVLQRDLQPKHGFSMSFLPRGGVVQRPRSSTCRVFAWHVQYCWSDAVCAMRTGSLLSVYRPEYPAPMCQRDVCRSWSDCVHILPRGNAVPADDAGGGAVMPARNILNRRSRQLLQVSAWIPVPCSRRQS